ncbi:MAG: hypothetical protein JJ879_08000 [Sneathiella sp.]|nr:hypothetical protein [Sneathiella sp.]
MSENMKKTYWLDKAENKKKIFIGLIIAAILVALPDFLSLLGILYETHPYTKVEEIPAFYGIYAALGLLVVISVAGFIGRFLTVKEDYYD